MLGLQYVLFCVCLQTSEEEKFDEDVQAAWEAYLLQLQDASEFVNTQTPLMTQKLEDKYQVGVTPLPWPRYVRISSSSIKHGQTTIINPHPPSFSSLPMTQIREDKYYLNKTGSD